jgi:hypothetical protein
MKVTETERLTIQKYLNYYYEEFAESKDALPFRVQMNLLYNHLFEIEE